MGKIDVDGVLDEVSQLMRTTDDPDARMKKICELLAERVAHYDWVGFYLVNPEDPNELIIGPYVGDYTDHTSIRFGKGICGQVAEREETLVIPDVREQDNYLSCSIHVRSEIVVPIMRDGKVIGEVDIDSHAVDPFGPEDTKLLEGIAELMAPLL